MLALAIMRRMHITPWLSLLALFIANVAYAVEIDGRYDFAKSEKSGKNTIENAIQDGTRDMFFVTRGVARDRLEKKNKLAKSLEFDTSAQEITVIFDGER